MLQLLLLQLQLELQRTIFHLCLIDIASVQNVIEVEGWAAVSAETVRRGAHNGRNVNRWFPNLLDRTRLLIQAVIDHVFSITLLDRVVVVLLHLGIIEDLHHSFVLVS